MSETLRNYTKALYGFDAVVQRVPSDRWDADTPCEGWTARDVVAHSAGVVDALAQMATTGTVAMPEHPDAGGDIVGLWNTSRDGLTEALDHPGVIGRVGEYWFGETPFENVLAFAQWDPLLHAWDLATATGVEAPADDDLAEASLAVIGPVADMLRQQGLMGDPVDVPADAPASTRLLGLTGRDPNA
jgi:uncharacterized protein (TIGR03086 family)